MIDRIHGGNIWLYDKKAIDFSANINPLGLPSRTKEVILKNLNTLVHYPEPESCELKDALAIFHNISQNNILVGNGSIELIHLIPRALKARNVLIIGPTFSEYEFATRSSGVKPFFVLASEQDNFRIDMRRVKKFIPKSDLIFLCNPNNPTAFLMPKSDILEIFDSCKKYHTILVIDEVFMDFVKDSQNTTLVSEATRHNELLVLKSLTKFFALAGLRLGYLIGHRFIIERMSRLQYPWNVNSLAQIVAREVIKDKAYLKKSKTFILKEKNFLFENLKKIKGLKVYYPSANFVFCKLQDTHIQNSIKLYRKLLREAVIIRTCDNFRGLNGKFFRIAIRTRSENKQLILCLREILE